jgi:hypothetical protein
MFQFFPKTLYFINDFDYQKVTDLNISAQLTQYIKKIRTSRSIRQFTVLNGERPDLVSNRLYGTPKYEYLILLLNDIESIYDDWPRDSITFNNYIKKKYGSITAASSTVGFWYTGDDDQIAKEYWDTLINDPKKYTKTFFQHETDLNDEKAKINIFDIQIAIKFETGLQELFDNIS